MIIGNLRHICVYIYIYKLQLRLHVFLFFIIKELYIAYISSQVLATNTPARYWSESI